MEPANFLTHLWKGKQKWRVQRSSYVTVKKISTQPQVNPTSDIQGFRLFLLFHRLFWLILGVQGITCIQRRNLVLCISSTSKKNQWTQNTVLLFSNPTTFPDSRLSKHAAQGSNFGLQMSLGTGHWTSFTLPCELKFKKKRERERHGNPSSSPPNL